MKVFDVVTKKTTLGKSAGRIVVNDTVSVSAFYRSWSMYPAW